MSFRSRRARRARFIFAATAIAALIFIALKGIAHETSFREQTLLDFQSTEPDAPLQFRHQRPETRRRSTTSSPSSSQPFGTWPGDEADIRTWDLLQLMGGFSCVILNVVSRQVARNVTAAALDNATTNANRLRPQVNWSDVMGKSAGEVTETFIESCWLGYKSMPFSGNSTSGPFPSTGVPPHALDVRPLLSHFVVVPTAQRTTSAAAANLFGRRSTPMMPNTGGSSLSGTFDMLLGYRYVIVALAAAAVASRASCDRADAMSSSVWDDVAAAARMSGRSRVAQTLGSGLTASIANVVSQVACSSAKGFASFFVAPLHCQALNAVATGLSIGAVLPLVDQMKRRLQAALIPAQ